MSCIQREMKQNEREFDETMELLEGIRDSQVESLERLERQLKKRDFDDEPVTWVFIFVFFGQSVG